MTLKRILAVCWVLALAATSAFADIAYIGQANSGGGLQGWQGPLGMEFVVNQPITIKYMGVYNAFAPNDAELLSTLEVAIFDTSGNEVAGTDTTFQPGTLYIQFLPVDAYDLFQAIAPVTLQAGEYFVVAGGFNSAQPNGNQGNGGVGAAEGMQGSITYAGLPRYGVAPGFYYPDVVDTYPAPGYPNGGPPNRYDAGTFATPEPGFYGLFALCLTIAGLIAAIWRRRALSLRITGVAPTVDGSDVPSPVGDGSGDTFAHSTAP